jgi:hypothetical protein
MQISLLTLDPVLSTSSIKNNYRLLSPYFQRLGISVSDEILDHLSLLEEITMSTLLNKVMYKIKRVKELDESLQMSPSIQQDHFSTNNSLYRTQPPLEIPHSAGGRMITTPLIPNSLNNTYPVYSDQPSNMDLRVRHMAQKQQNFYLRQLREQQV